MSEAKAEGWTSNAKYKTLPELMLRYRAATLLIRTHIPEVLNGMHTVEELTDVEAAKHKPNTHLKDISDKEKSVSTINSYLEEDEEVEIKTVDVEDNRALSEDFANKVDNLESLIALYQVPKETVDLWLQKAQVESIDALSKEKIEACIDYIDKKFNSENM